MKGCFPSTGDAQTITGLYVSAVIQTTLGYCVVTGTADDSTKTLTRFNKKRLNGISIKATLESSAMIHLCQGTRVLFKIAHRALQSVLEHIREQVMGMLWFVIGVVTGLVIASVVFLYIDYQYTKANKKRGIR